MDSNKHKSSIDFVFAVSWLPIPDSALTAARCLSGLLKDEMTGEFPVHCFQSSNLDSDGTPRSVKN
jgi:hypothetical protein